MHISMSVGIFPVTSESEKKMNQRCDEFVTC